MLLPLIDNLFILITCLLAAVCLNLNKMVVCQKKKNYLQFGACILLEVFVCSIAEYFTSCAVFWLGWVKIQTTSKNTQQYYTPERV